MPFSLCYLPTAVDGSDHEDQPRRHAILFFCSSSTSQQWSRPALQLAVGAHRDLQPLEVITRLERSARCHKPTMLTCAPAGLSSLYVAVPLPKGVAIVREAGVLDPRLQQLSSGHQAMLARLRYSEATALSERQAEVRNLEARRAQAGEQS